MIYSGLQGKVYRMLQQVSWTRERVNKDKALVKLLTLDKPWDGEITAFRLSELVELAKDFNSADRYWRLLTSAHPELRGSDYDTKPIVEQRKQIEIGYEPNYKENLRKLETIV